MATLHLRNVPTKIYERLRRRAKQNGRSMNAEAVALLEDAVEREDRTGSITAELRQLANTINLPPDAPRAEEIIRQDRESH